MTSTASAGDSKTDPGLHVVAKPIGPTCNLNCDYCFYRQGTRCTR